LAPEPSKTVRFANNPSIELFKNSKNAIGLRRAKRIGFTRISFKALGLSRCSLKPSSSLKPFSDYMHSIN
jgi:hypothetical protein